MLSGHNKKQQTNDNNKILRLDELQYSRQISVAINVFLSHKIVMLLVVQIANICALINHINRHLERFMVKKK